MPHFANIIIQLKKPSEFEAWLHCQDDNGMLWELVGSGKTVSEAADAVWEQYKNPESWPYVARMIDPRVDTNWVRRNIERTKQLEKIDEWLTQNDAPKST